MNQRQSVRHNHALRLCLTAVVAKWILLGQLVSIPLAQGFTGHVSGGLSKYGRADATGIISMSKSHDETAASNKDSVLEEDASLDADGLMELDETILNELCQSFNDSPIQVLYQDENILAIDKPSGIPHHNDLVDSSNSQTRETKMALPGIVTLVRYQLQHGLVSFSSSAEDGTSTEPMGISTRIYGVHRLDKVTSGILLFAKNPETAQVLTQAFRDKEIIKFYTGLAFPKPKKKKQGLVQGWLHRGRRKSWMLSTDKNKKKTSNEEEGLYCQTRFYTAGLGHLIPAESSTAALLPKTLIWFRPYTGRTHQLRVTAKSVGLPLAGDPIYVTSLQETNTLMNRTCLHATSMIIPAKIVAQMPNGERTTSEDIVLWSTPPFGHYYENGLTSAECLSNSASSSNSASWNASLYGLIEKHCQEFPTMQKLARDQLLEQSNG